jgi:gamma-carbonic anhydrase
MDGATVKATGMLAAGALLTPGKTVGPGELWSGRPARFTRKLSQAEVQAIRDSADSYSGMAAE